MSESQPVTARGTQTGFWISVGMIFVVMVVSWNWYGLAQFEAQTDQSKALAANTTMAGFGAVVGAAPLALAHLLSLGLLLPLGWRGWRWKGLAIGLAMTIAASVLGIVAGQLVWGGALFELGVHNDPMSP
ncbi:hypothetical protein [Pseudoclavibacter helvolus]|uniref:Uncharacterized protein n=1 Tax=Pseudoclavibacter helvolus TaxID=255205 RepID=A0A7W4UT33_9MICO|nr:hypothetical protein [Pseudoclavibacter helvolus]MBB2959624.1 hypothetical protein [Pseudoclavibacter helvolus]